MGDDTLRPNLLLAYGLPYGPLRGSPPAPAVTDRLLTPLGLRTLDPDAPGYTGRHRGGPAGRDRAYHQGTVWPWLIGPYVDTRHATGPPHRATGCPFQAWSVTEPWRARRLVQELGNRDAAR